MTNMDDSGNILETHPADGRLKDLVIATHNKGKLIEFRDMLAPYVENLIAASDLGLPEPEETGASFAENAILKARAASTLSGRPSLADDSGLCVNALGGEPGIFSARWAGPGRDFRIAMKKVEDALQGKNDHSAYFITVLALAYPDGRTVTKEGRVDGRLVFPPRGAAGHGYDPIFQPENMSKTFAEMAESEKNAVSHRGRALRILIDDVFV